MKNEDVTLFRLSRLDRFYLSALSDYRAIFGLFYSHAYGTVAPFENFWAKSHPDPEKSEIDPTFQVKHFYLIFSKFTLVLE
jgi:hypothetical protein